jgi:hypothetical protein
MDTMATSNETGHRNIYIDVESPEEDDNIFKNHHQSFQYLAASFMKLVFDCFHLVFDK